LKLLTVNEVSEILKAKPKTIYQWAELGQIPCIKISGCLRFDLDDIVNWIKSCKKEPSSGYNPLTQARGPRKGGDD
jgi:excisionase family DNA binding protein